MHLILNKDNSYKNNNSFLMISGRIEVNNSFQIAYY